MHFTSTLAVLLAAVAPLTVHGVCHHSGMSAFASSQAIAALGDICSNHFVNRNYGMSDTRSHCWEHPSFSGKRWNFFVTRSTSSSTRPTKDSCVLNLRREIENCKTGGYSHREDGFTYE
jgi:hypothetical protein